MLLVGAMLYSTGCTDYGTDIENLENKVDQIQEELQKGQIDPLKADLAQTKEDLANAQAAIEALTAKHNEDIAALKAVDSQLDGKIAAANDSILALEAALQQEVAALEAEIAALETAIAQAKQEAKDADAALKAELLQEITDLETELLAKVNDLQSKLEGDIEDLRDNMQEKIDAANEAIEDANDAIDALDLRADALEQTDAALEAEIDALEAEIEATKAKIAVLESDLAAEKAARETADAEEKAAREAAVKALEESIAALETKLNTQVALLEDAIEALNTKVDTEVAALKQRDAELAEELAATQAGLAALASEVEAKYNELKGDIAALKAELKAEIDANKAAIAQNKADIDRAFVAIETLGDNLAALQASVEAVNNTLFALMSDYYSFKAQITGRVAALESSVANLETLYAEVAEELIPALEEQIAQNAALIEQNAADLKANAAELEAYKKAAAETYALLEQADAALWQAISSLNQTVYENRSDIAALRAELVESLAGVRAEVEAAFAAVYSQLEEMAKIQAAQYGVLVDSIEAVRELTANNAYAIAQEIEARQAADAAIVKDLNEFKAAYEVKMVELDDAIAALESRITALEEDLAAYKVAVAKAIEDAVAEAVETSNEYTDLQIELAVNTINTKIAEVEKTIADLDAAYKAADAAIREDMVKRDDVLQDQINEIVKRAQSLVFVPEYTDGKGTIKFAKAGETVVESRSKAEYQVYPAECAKAIVSAFKENPILSFDHEYLATRANNVSFDVVAVEEGAKDGRIVVTFEPRGLDAEFYAGTTEKEYALSLVLTTEKVNLSSAYTNFVRAKKADAISMNIMLGDEVISGCYPSGKAYEFEYTDNVTVKSVLPEHYVVFSVNGKTYNGIEALNAAGYSVSMNRENYIKRIYNQNLGYRPFSITENENSILEVKVDEVNGKLIYQNIYVGYTYTLGTLVAEAYSNYTTTPVTSTIVYDAIDINWMYAEDVNVDAAIYAGEDAVYSRTNRALGDYTFEKELPADVTDLAMVFNSSLLKDTEVVVTLDGQKVDVNAAFGLDDENNVVISSFSGFEWDKTYEVTAVYGVEPIKGQISAQVTVKAIVNTHDRERGLIEIELEEEDWYLTKDFIYQSETVAESMDKIYNRFENTLGEMTAEDLYENIFSKSLLNEVNLANEKEMENTKLVLVNGGADVKSVYNVSEYTDIPESINYEYTFTTWFGDDVKITKTLNTGLEPVSIRLADYSRQIVANDKFVTDANSLAEIFVKVSRVKEGEFTAAEYLAAIFADNKFRPKRAQKDLANDSELAGTKLVVAPKDGATAVATYDYEDFTEAAPMVVNYVTTYTTWYGQEITIEKTVNFGFDEYVFDFKHNSQYVYGAGVDFYSKVQPAYTWYNGAEDQGMLEFSVADVVLPTAFYVVKVDKVNGTQTMLTEEDMASLSLSYSFEIEDQANIHSGITMKPGYRISYYGSTPKTYVHGNLVITNSNGTEYVVPTSFDKDGKYESFNVVKFNPIGSASTTLENDTLTVNVNNSKKYQVKILNYVQLMDHRSNGRQSYELINNETGSWVVGNGQNGFAPGVDVRADYIYRIAETWAYDPSNVEDTYAEILPYIDFNTADGTLTFDNTHQLELTRPFTIPVTLKFQNCWMENPEVVTVKVTFNPIK